MFNTIEVEADVTKTGDSLGGPKVFESNLYSFKIVLAYGSVTKSGAKAMNLLLESEEGEEFKTALYMTSGTAKGGLSYYMAKNPKTGNKDIKKSLPGFELVDDLCRMTINKRVNEIVTETKTIMLYDYMQRKEVPTDVPMVTELLGKQIYAGVLKQVSNKRVKDPGSGEYVAITETREENEINKFFHHPTGLTVTEAQAKEPAAFKEQWTKKWAGVTKDKTSKDAIADPTKGDNTAASGSATPSAPREGASLFGGASNAA